MGDEVDLPKKEAVRLIKANGAIAILDDGTETTTQTDPGKETRDGEIGGDGAPGGEGAGGQGQDAA